MQHKRHCEIVGRQSLQRKASVLHFLSALFLTFLMFLMFHIFRCPRQNFLCLLCSLLLRSTLTCLLIFVAQDSARLRNFLHPYGGNVEGNIPFTALRGYEQQTKTARGEPRCNKGSVVTVPNVFWKTRKHTPRYVTFYYPKSLCIRFMVTLPPYIWCSSVTCRIGNIGRALVTLCCKRVT